MRHGNELAELVYIERLRLAAWMQFNGQQLLERRLSEGGRVIYVFKRSAETETLVQKWDDKTASELALSKYSNIVSFEIQKAVRMRRAAGMSTRLRTFEKS